MKAKKLLILFLVFIQVSLTAEETPKVTSYSIKIRLSADSQKDTAKVNSLIKQGTKYLSSKGLMAEKAKACIDSAKQICEQKKLETPASLHLLNARYCFATKDMRTASEEADIALKKATANEEGEILARVHFFLGDFYLSTGSFKESIDSYGNAIKIARKEKMKNVIPAIFFGQANVFKTVGDVKGYRDKLNEMANAALEEKDTLRAAKGLYFLGTSFCGDTVTSNIRDFKKADSVLRKSLLYSKIIKDTSTIASSLANMGWNFYLNTEFDSSVVCYDKSLKYSMPGNLFSASANSLGNLGTIYRDLGKPETSVKFYYKGIQEAKKVNDIYNLWWIYRDMSYLYINMGDTANAYRCFVQYKKFHDQYQYKSSIQGLDDARIRYEADAHRKEVELLSLKLKSNRLLNYGFTVLILLATAIGLLLFRGSKLKAEHRIAEMNQKISEITQANLRQQMNPHFIFNTLNSIQYYMYQHDKLATNTYLTKFSSLMRKVLDNSQHTSVPLADELSALNLYLELESLRFKDKFEYRINIDEEIDPLIHKVPTMLIQPYVENSICHGLMPKEGKGFVNIDLKLNQEFILCTIEDNGIGRDAARERNQKRETNHNSLGTQITKTRLDLVNELYGTSLKTIYTDLRNENGEPSGTRVEIHIPIIA
jgi:tetratricopeptide (TPR) repeat protein